VTEDELEEILDRGNAAQEPYTDADLDTIQRVGRNDPPGCTTIALGVFDRLVAQARSANLSPEDRAVFVGVRQFVQEVADGEHPIDWSDADETIAALDRVLARGAR
jgi:hypothetical protein